MKVATTLVYLIKLFIIKLILLPVRIVIKAIWILGSTLNHLANELEEAVLKKDITNFNT